MKKILTKILAIALICVITVTSMGAYGVTAKNESSKNNQVDLPQKEIAVFDNQEGFFAVENTQELLKRGLHSEKIVIKETREFKDIFEDAEGEFYKEVTQGKFKKVKKQNFKLNKKESMSEIMSFNLPKEITADIQDVMLWSEREQVNPDAEVVLFSDASGLIATTYATKNGIDIRIYDVRFINMTSGWENIAKGTSVTMALLTTVKEIVSYSPDYLPIAIFESFITAADAWKDVFGGSSIIVNVENKLSLKLNYNMRVKYGFAENPELQIMKHATTLSAVELKEIHTHFSYRKRDFVFDEEEITRYVGEMYKVDEFDDAVNIAYQFRDVNSVSYSAHVDDMYVEYKSGFFNKKTRLEIVPPTYKLPDHWFTP